MPSKKRQLAARPSDEDIERARRVRSKPPHPMRPLSIEYGDGDRFTVTAQVPSRPGWTFSATYGRTTGAWAVEELTVAPRDDARGVLGPPTAPAGGITQQLLRKIPLGPNLAELIRDAAGPAGAPLLDELTGGEWIKELRARPRPGRGGRDDYFYADLAMQYLDKVAVSRQPIQALAIANGFSASTVRDWLAEARRRELLERPGKGRAGGRLTPKALELLQEDR